MSSFLEKLNSIKSDLGVEKRFSRDSFFEYCINKKLKNVVNVYNQGLDFDSQTLLHKDSTRVIKAITKMQKLKDREVLKSYMVMKNKSKRTKNKSCCEEEENGGCN